MQHLEDSIRKIKNALLALVIFLFPLFFLPVTQEFFLTNKLYLLAFSGAALLAISTVGIIATRKISWKKDPLDGALGLLLLAVIISIAFFSPNRIQAVLSQYSGLLMFFSVGLLFIYLKRASADEHKKLFIPVLEWSALILSLVTIIFFFQPFKTAALPFSMQFLKNPSFTPMGSRVDLAIFLGFFVVYKLVEMISSHTKKLKPFDIGFFISATLATALTLYRLMRPENAQQAIVLPPYSISWYAALEVFKSPLSAFFGAGIDNFAAVFTKAKDAAYDLSQLWAINSFAVSRSAVLQILTEAGLLGLAALTLLLFTAGKEVGRHVKERPVLAASLLYMTLVLLLAPPSLPVFFLFFVLLGLIPVSYHVHPQTLDLREILPAFILVIGASVLFIGGYSYGLIRTYSAEYYYRKSLVGLAENNLATLYNNQQKAIVLNPYIERFRIGFSQANIIVATNVVQKAKKNDKGQTTLTTQERQTVAQAVQQAIGEAKAAVSLNPQKSLNWENLATIYRSLINAAQGADVWTVSSYQRAIVLDPKNVIYHLDLGGVYYFLKNYDEAIRLFEDTVSLKPDWANANYNLAWANYQKGNYNAATQWMENTLKLVDQRLQPDDYKKVKSELVEFKKKLPKDGSSATESATGNLNLPQQPETVVDPKLQLDKSASPEAR